MLKMIPKHWLTWNCDIYEDEVSIAQIHFSAWSQTGEITITGDRYRVYRESLLSANFFLEQDNAHLAWATKPSLFRVFEVYYANQRYELKAKSGWTRIFLLEAEGETIGVIQPEHAWTRRAQVDLPLEFPLVVRLFMLWLVLIIWKQDSASNVAATSGTTT